MIVNKYHVLFSNNITKQYQTEIVNGSRMTEAISKCESLHGFHIDIIKCVNINALRELQVIAEDADVIKAEQEIQKEEHKQSLKQQL